MEINKTTAVPQTSSVCFVDDVMHSLLEYDTTSKKGFDYKHGLILFLPGEKKKSP